jgi:hypothetical protein
MIKTVTEILHAADAINARNDAERNIFYGRPVDFEHALAHGEQFIINAYRAGIFSFEVLQATARVVRGYRDEFRRIIMSTRCLPENTPWPEYDVKYRSTPLEIILAQAEPNAVALAPRLLSEIERYKRNFAKLYGKDNIGTNDIQVMLFLDYDDSGNIISSYTSSRLVETQDSSVMKISHDGLARQFGLYNKGYCAILFVFKIINGKYDIIEAIPTINRLLIPATKRNIYIKTVKLAVEILEKLGYPREVIDGVSFYPSSTLLGEAETRSLVDKRGGDINEVTIYDVAELTEMPLNQTLQTDEPAPLKPPSQHSDIAILQSA